ncbi:MAG: DUF3990 domain-containing protein [Bacteroidaceae bacterium]|nr:DUF3990 domain-containing protein [Bacteroidaceae bacterium]
MILHHGTNIDFDTIDLKKSKPNKDFGKGFYLSANYDQAMAMANVKVEQLELGAPIVLSYEIDESLLEKLNVKQFDCYSEEWAEFILLNRRNASEQPAHNYDVVFGPIANDRVGVQLWKYETQSIDLPTLVRNLQHMKGITFQYFFGTEEAVKLLKRI